MSAADQFISPEQWGSLKSTVSMLNSAEADSVDLPEWFFQLRDQLQELIVSATHPVKPFEVSEHFCYLLDMYVAGSTVQDEVANGSRLVVEWAQETIGAAGKMGIKPIQNGTKSIWLVTQALEGEVE